ncbi:HEAT repeat protein [Dictyocaulus viviparus]|uniref:HEAT repeat protein n=1 Tax=Dictyocaulus viviparus TaxID=29172 RepID=A0A0D8XNP0_DICVI|nr:HEAT repeat protein [Dictyocaulus viviparus]
MLRQFNYSRMYGVIKVCVSNALPGNPLLREYEIGDHTCVAGPGFYWKIFKGVKKSTKKVVSIWIFDKKDIDRWPKEDRELFLTLIKHGVSQLTRLRHPRLLVIEHPIEESRDSLAFASELVFACLSSCIIRREHLSLCHNDLSNFSFSDMERKHGLLQLGEALSFLHNDARILHRNVTPESVIVNDRVRDYCSIINKLTNRVDFVYESFTWNDRTTTVSQPNLDYLAPEYVVGDGCSIFSDIYSLGALSFAVYNEGRPPFEHKNDLHIFKRNIPKIAYFNDPLIKTLNLFESLIQMENSQKIQFFKSLPTVLVMFEKRVLLQKILPCLCSEFTTPDLIPFLLPSIFLIVEMTSKDEFSSEILPQIIPLFSIEKPYQIALLLLQKMELLLERASEEHVKRYILPLVYSAIHSETIRIQELCLSVIPNIGKLVDRNSMKTELLPKLLELAISGSVLAIRVQSLVCIGKLLPTLESWMITDLILPALPKIRSREPGVLMAILGKSIYKLIANCESIVINRDQWAKSVLPFLLPISVENTLNLGQFEQFMAFIKFLIGIVERNQRLRLQQHCTGHEQQMYVCLMITPIMVYRMMKSNTPKDRGFDIVLILEAF